MSRNPRAFLTVGMCLALFAAAAWFLKPLLNQKAIGEFGSTRVRPKAPDFPRGFAWLNTARPLSFHKQLKGQVVLLDFWTYCCINCIHILPMLDHIQHKFRHDPFIIIGVHSAKFSNESHVATIRAAIERYKIRHPVIVDQKMRIWNSYGVDSWPTLVLIDSTGHIAGAVSGEGHQNLLEHAIEKLLRQGKRRGTLAKTPLEITLEGSVRSASGLSFPGKVLADKRDRELFIADSDHNRIVETAWPNARGHARLPAIYGSGKMGRADGPATGATFNNPQGMAMIGHDLYVADTDNNLIRAIDLSTVRVRTVLGNGRQTFDISGGKKGRRQGLNSPWGLAANGTTLYISMAGEHQIWAMNTQTDRAKAIAGSGFENIKDGRGLNACFAQPSGLTISGNDLYVADSEDSGARRVDLSTMRVSTLVGHGLFIFGLVNGSFNNARLQHPLGIAMFHHNVLVADTYDHVLRLLDLRDRRVTTFIGTGKPGAGKPGGPLQLFEPGGVSVAGNTIFVADTDNQRIVIINGKTKAWKELVVDGLTAPRARRANSTRGHAIAAARATINPGQNLTLTIPLALPPHTHLTPGAPLSVSIDQGNNVVTQQTLSAPRIPVQLILSRRSLAAAQRDPADPWTITLDYTYCSDGPASVCRPGHAAYRAKINYGTGGKRRWSLRVR